jgi:hypothetical protein
MTPLEEIRERGRRNIESARRTNAIVCLVIGTVFGFFALGCVVTAVGLVVAAGSLGAGDASVGAAVGVGVFGLFWCAMTVLLVALGRRGLKKIDRDRRLRTSGVRGWGTVLNYSESSFMVDGATNWQLALRVALEGRPPYDVMANVGVVRGEGARIYQGATLPVLVDPGNPTDVMVVLDGA